MQPCGPFQLLPCSHLAFPPSGISGHVAPWQVYGTSPVGQSIMIVAGWIPNRKHEAQALFRERARLSIQYFALQI